jgi:hypothetical protein
LSAGDGPQKAVLVKFYEDGNDSLGRTPGSVHAAAMTGTV